MAGGRSRNLFSPPRGEAVRLEIISRAWFTSLGVTYFFIFVVTLVIGAMATLMVAERLKRAEKRTAETRPRLATKGKQRGKKKRRH